MGRLPLALVAADAAYGKSETKKKLQLSQDAKVTAEEAIKTATDKFQGR